MPFGDELRMVLKIEREGKKRLEEARSESQRIIETAREKARLLLQEADEVIARERKEKIAETDLETDKLIDDIRHRLYLEEDRLQSLAEKNREAAVRRILSWLWGET